MSNSNYLIIGAVVIAAIALIVWLVFRNLKDKKDFERELIEAETETEEDKDNGQIKL